jgi:hypothetical protein
MEDSRDETDRLRIKLEAPGAEIDIRGVDVSTSSSNGVPSWSMAYLSISQLPLEGQVLKLCS